MSDGERWEGARMSVGGSEGECVSDGERWEGVRVHECV